MRTGFIRGLILDRVNKERSDQDKQWGQQHHPPHRGSVQMYRAKADAYKNVGNNDAWDFILLEEVYEALAETDPDLMQEELIQVAAVAVAWAEDIEREKRGEN